MRWPSCLFNFYFVFRELSDSRFELYNMIQNFGFWMMKHAAWVAAKDEVFDSDAKECLTCLRRAAGMFAFVAERAGQLSGATELEGSDFDTNVMKAYELQVPELTLVHFHFFRLPPRPRRWLLHEQSSWSTITCSFLLWQQIRLESFRKQVVHLLSLSSSPFFRSAPSIIQRRRIWSMEKISSAQAPSLSVIRLRLHGRVPSERRQVWRRCTSLQRGCLRVQDCLWLCLKVRYSNRSR